MIIIIIYFLSVFHISFSWWFFTAVFVTASLLKSPGLFLVFWPFSIMLKFGWSPLLLRTAIWLLKTFSGKEFSIPQLRLAQGRKYLAPSVNLRLMVLSSSSLSSTPQWRKMSNRSIRPISGTTTDTNTLGLNEFGNWKQWRATPDSSDLQIRNLTYSFELYPGHLFLRGVGILLPLQRIQSALF